MIFPFSRQYPWGMIHFFTSLEISSCLVPYLPSSPSPNKLSSFSDFLSCVLSLTLTSLVNYSNLDLRVFNLRWRSFNFNSFSSDDFSSRFFCLTMSSIFLPFSWWSFFNSASWILTVCHSLSLISWYSSYLSLSLSFSFSSFFSTFPG